MSSTELELSTQDRLEALARGYDPDMTFKSLMLEAEYGKRGFTLVPKSALAGIPFIVIAITYREGFARNDRVGDYVSLEAVCAGPELLATLIDAGRIQEPLNVFPNEPVVFNDGSTGIRRDITSLLHERGIINVGPSPDEKEGILTKFDRPFQFWTDPPDPGVRYEAYPDGTPLRLRFDGLRVSEYQNPVGAPGQMSETWYFA